MESWLIEKFNKAKEIWLFLDYDGTLADFAPTPDHVLPDDELIQILENLAALSCIRLTILSGRRLAHIEKLVPIPGILLAGTYGIELRLPDGSYPQRLRFEDIRPLLNRLKPAWSRLIEGKEGYYLEDKGWTLALHASRAPDASACEVLNQARQKARDILSQADYLLKGGHKFLEAAPELANKHSAVKHLVSKYPFPGALLVYLGDDDKDEVAFEAVQELGGIAGAVGNSERASCADFRLSSPWEVRRWLEHLLQLKNC